MNTPKQNRGDVAQTEAQPDRSRRRFVQGGVGATPLLMTLVSQPVLGSARCYSPSGFVSMNTSRNAKFGTCSGRTPGYWKSKNSMGGNPSQGTPKWPIPTTTLFSAYFNPVPPPQNPGTFTLLDAVSLPEGPPHNVTRHIAASLLNVLVGLVPAEVLTAAVLQQIWQQYMATGGGLVGYYEPTAGVKWYHDEITAYLQSTMPAA
jgi:hypothetical protein